jgi:hypothetical protein
MFVSSMISFAPALAAWRVKGTKFEDFEDE